MDANTLQPDARLDGLIDLLLTVGYVDGAFHEHERNFVRDYLDKLVVHLGLPAGAAEAWRLHFDNVYQRLDAELATLALEVVATGDAQFVRNKMKVRALTLFRGFAPVDQAQALDVLGALVQADGIITPDEKLVHDELVSHFRTHQPAAHPAPALSELMSVGDPQPVEPKSFGHVLLSPLEQRYSPDPGVLRAQVHGDHELIYQAITAWERQRARGNGRLAGVTDVAQIPKGSRFLDGHIHLQRSDQPSELIVLGDLHGCYSCLKAALLQTDFIERARRNQQDPANHPDVKLVLLGDYIDRGIYSFEGVLRAALQLFVALPNHVVLLRGNHELLVRVDGQIYSAVNPAEAVHGIAGHVGADVLDSYRHLFDHMPTAFIYDRTLFTHAGIPRDDTFAERYRDLSSLEDFEMRFQMMWSDPAQVDHVPVEVQRETPRFSFGREQFRAFMTAIGCHTLIRGHEQVNTGFKTNFDLGDRRLHTLFSAGGHDNPDLPADSRYRNVTPMALTIRQAGGELHATPWPIRYQPFCVAERNGLYA